MRNRAAANLEALIESTEDLIGAVDLDFRLIAFNQALSGTIEKNRGVNIAMGMRVEDFVPSELAALFNNYFQRALAEGPFRTEFTTLDGRVLEIAFNPIVAGSKKAGVAIFGKDISDRSQATANLSALIESTSDFIWSVDRNYRLITFNGELKRAFEASFGITPVEGMLPQDLLPPERAALSPPMYERALADGPFRAEYKTLDGRTVEMAFNPIVVRGEKTGISVFGKDITELKKSMANLSALIESTEDFIWSVDLDFRLLTFNRVLQHDYEATFGKQAAVGKSPEELLPPSIAANWSPLYKRALAEGPFRTEYTFLSGRILELSLNPIIVDGRAVGISVFGKDVTEQKAAEKARLEAEKKYRDIFDGALEGIFQTSLDGRLLTANPSLVEMLGYDPRDYSAAVGRQIAVDVWVDPDDRLRFLHLLEEKKVIRGYACRFKRQDGTVFWVSLNARRILAADGVTPINEGFIEDITERKQAVDALREREARLREAEQLALAGSSSWDVDADKTTWSEGMFSITGWDPKGSPPNHGQRRKLYAPESWVRLEAAVERALTRGEPYDLELQIVRADGVLRWTRARGRAARNELGRVHSLLGTLQDITEQKLSEAKIRESEERYRATFEQAAVGIVHTSFEGQILRCNSRFAEIIGYPFEDIPSLTVRQITAPGDADATAGAIEQLAGRESAPVTLEKSYLRKDGSLTWARATSSVQRDSDGRALHIVTFVEDINAQKAVEKRLTEALDTLRVSENRYRTVFQTSLDPVCITRLSDGQFIDVNRAFLETMGFVHDEVIGHSTLELSIWADGHERQNVVRILREDSSFRDIQARFRKKNGEVFWVMLSAAVIEIQGVTCLLGVFRDLSDAKAAEDQIRLLAFYDQLTRLPNRRLLLDRLKGDPDTDDGNARERALLLLDLDEFKKLNDTRGHQAGDLLLKDVARRLTACVRGADTVARCGGDEFAVLLESLGKIPEPAATHAQFVAGKIVEALGRPFPLGDQEYHCHCSIGIAVLGNEPGSPDLVMQQAELALHQAKADGRNTVRFFAPDLQSAAEAFAAIEQDLHQAISRKQFVLYYQPQVDSTGLIGVEALIRWNHPERGLLAPKEFIHLAEETGLILPLGEWALEAACTQIAAWAGQPEVAHLTLAANISALQFRRPEFVDQVLAVLDRTGANPQNLELELTESTLLEDIEGVIAKMSVLKSHGLKFSLDNFGTGYSSLSYLKRLPLDQLKIDRAFVQDILVDDTSGAIAQTIISLSRAMGLSVIAEGVETEEQRDFLTRLGCDSFQGYLFGYPLPIEVFEQTWLHST